MVAHGLQPSDVNQTWIGSAKIDWQRLCPAKENLQIPPVVSTYGESSAESDYS
jgi:hypothetical protein